MKEEQVQGKDESEGAAYKPHYSEITPYDSENSGSLFNNTYSDISFLLPVVYNS